MIHLPNTPRMFMELFGLAVRYHFAAFRKMVWLIIFLVIVKDAYIYLDGMPNNLYWYSVVGIVMGLLSINFLVAVLYTSHCVLNNEPIDWRNALGDTFSRMGRVILAMTFFILLPAVLFVLAEWIGRLVIAGNVHPYRYSGLVVILAVGVPVMIAYLYYFFTVPLIVTKNYSLWQAFQQAFALVGRQWRDLARVFGIYAVGMIIWLLISPNTLHGHFIKMYKISALFDFIILGISLPIWMNFIILMANDLKLRRQISH